MMDIGEVVKDGFKLIHDDNDIKEYTPPKAPPI
jgi:hypothetical protein